MSAGNRCDRISLWLVQPKEGLGWQMAAVTLTNRNARILWPVLTHGEAFNPNHVPVPPAARCCLKPPALVKVVAA